MVGSLRRTLSGSIVGNERGGILVFVAVGLVTLLVGAGLAIDVGRGYLLKAHVSRAVDAAALAAARSLRGGKGEARQRAVAIAMANGIDLGEGGKNFSLSFGKNEFGEETVTVRSVQEIPTLLMRLVGHEEIEVRSEAVAAVPPIDLVLVLDQSGSLEDAGAWDDLQAAVKQFVRHFDDDVDQLGLISFNIMAKSHFPVGHPFIAQATAVVNAMGSLGTTNTGEGLRLAHDQFESVPGIRDRSAKVVVFFTDGRPTAFRGIIGGQDRVLAAYLGSNLTGYWNNPESLPIHIRPPPDGCVNAFICFGYRKADVFDNAEATGAYWANEIRKDEVLIYAIGLGDTSKPPGHILQPGQDYLRLLANEDGVADPGQVKGKMFFAPSAGEIRAVFNLVAQDLLARLAH